MRLAILEMVWAIIDIDFVGVRVVGGMNARFRCYKGVVVAIIIRPGCCFPALKVFICLSSRSFDWSSHFISF